MSEPHLTARMFAGQMQAAMTNAGAPGETPTSSDSSMPNVVRILHEAKSAGQLGELWDLIDGTFVNNIVASLDQAARKKWAPDLFEIFTVDSCPKGAFAIRLKLLSSADGPIKETAAAQELLELCRLALQTGSLKVSLAEAFQAAAAKTPDASLPLLLAIMYEVIADTGFESDYFDKYASLIDQMEPKDLWNTRKAIANRGCVKILTEDYFRSLAPQKGRLWGLVSGATPEDADKVSTTWFKKVFLDSSASMAPLGEDISRRLSKADGNEAVIRFAADFLRHSKGKVVAKEKQVISMALAKGLPIALETISAWEDCFVNGEEKNWPDADAAARLTVLKHLHTAHRLSARPDWTPTIMLQERPNWPDVLGCLAASDQEKACSALLDTFGRVPLDEPRHFADLEKLVSSLDPGSSLSQTSEFVVRLTGKADLVTAVASIKALCLNPAADGEFRGEGDQLVPVAGSALASVNSRTRDAFWEHLQGLEPARADWVDVVSQFKQRMSSAPSAPMQGKARSKGLFGLFGSKDKSN